LGSSALQGVCTMPLIGAVSSNTARDRHRMWRTLQIWLAYWIVIALSAMLLPVEAELEQLYAAAHQLVGGFDGVMQLSANASNPRFIVVFATICWTWSTLLCILSLFLLPSGSHLTFASWRKKSLMLLIGGALFALAFFVPEATQSEISLKEGRASAFLFLATTSRVAALLILGSLWGFAQLFAFQGLRLILVSPVQNSIKKTQGIEL
jgi:hypothetical protein